jgi:DNA polymerase V
MVHVNGESMIDENIDDGDILIVDSGAQPYDGKIVVASLNGELTVKTFREKKGRAWLISANKKFLPIEIGELVQFEIQGVVKHVIKKMN